MLIHKTVKVFKLWRKDGTGLLNDHHHYEAIQRTTWWVLFIPMLTLDHVIKTDMSV